MKFGIISLISLIAVILCVCLGIWNFLDGDIPRATMYLVLALLNMESLKEGKP